METLNSVMEWMVGIYLHPIVTLVVIVVIALGRQRFEGSLNTLAAHLWEQSAKATPESAASIVVLAKDAELKAARAGNYIFAAAGILAIAAQFSFYWPANGQAKAICFVMSVVQVGVAEAVYTYADKWGLMDRIGKLVQKKMDSVETKI